jgi:putative aminopeptidase
LQVKCALTIENAENPLKLRRSRRAFVIAERGTGMRVWIFMIAAGLLHFLTAQVARTQTSIDLADLQKIPAVSGHEERLSTAIKAELAQFTPKTDNLGNVFVTIGSGVPHRLIVTSMDEPGYVVSEITPDGYLRVQRLPQAAPNPVFDTLQFAQPVWVMIRNGKTVPGVFAGLSVHLQPGRPNAPKMNHVEELYVDIGAASASEVRAAGVDVLDSIALQRKRHTIGNSGWAGPATGDRIGCAVLLQLLTRIKESKAKGVTTIAFVTEQWTGGRGLNRLLTEIHPDEMIFVGRLTPTSPTDKAAKFEEPKPGSGVILGASSDSKEGGDSLLGRLKLLAETEKIPLRVATAAPPRIVGYAKTAPFPEQLVELGVPSLWPATPGESVSWEDVGYLESELETYLDIPKPVGGIGSSTGSGHGQSDIEVLTETYGASGHEEAVRKTMMNRLPEWARGKTTTDAAGNLILHLGDEKRDPKTPSIAFVAHMDEIGYEVKKLEEDGRLQVEVLGGGYTQFFLGHVVLVHKKDGSDTGGVLELPEGWDKPGFEWPSGAKSMDEPAHVYVGTRSKEETEKLGIAAGDYVTIPKEYRPLLGTRANARSFDDRVGCAALLAAVRGLGPNLPRRDVTFVWSTEEELGLKGAAAFAEQAAKENHVPDFVFAIDTFVSSDSPLESKRFADAEIGKGFVVRAVDNSNIVPQQYVDHVVALAKEGGIPAQYGVTGGGNDGSVFLRYGSVDVALGWPLRYAHSPAEVIDLKDLDALGKIVEVLARNW